MIVTHFLMRTNSTIHHFTEIAIHAEDLKPVWESVPREPEIGEHASILFDGAPKFATIIIDVIQRQKISLCFSAASTFSIAVMLKYSLTRSVKYSLVALG